MRYVKLPEQPPALSPDGDVWEQGLMEINESSPECDDRSVKEMINEGDYKYPDFSGRKLNCRIQNPAYRDWRGN